MTLWDDRFATGHQQIDDEHREFCRQLDDIKQAITEGAGREQIVQLIVVLQKYVLRHFGREEAYMLRVNCPAMKANCAAHRELETKLERWLEVLTMSGTPVSVLTDVHRESTAWIADHILNIDCKLRGCVPKPDQTRQALSPLP